MDTTKALAQPVQTAAASQTNATTTVTITAPSQVGGQNTNTIFVTGIMISASAAPAATQRATVTGPQAANFGINLPAAAFAPIVLPYGTHPLIVTAGANLVVSVPALGAGVVCDVVVHYYIGTL